MNCWEFMNCGHHSEVSKGAGNCPAYPNHGKSCARVAGTLCGGRIQGVFAIKLTSCMKCDYYNSAHYDRFYTGLNN